MIAEIQRVLKPTGSFWLNLGDSYSRQRKYGAVAKSLLLGPERLLIRLLADGWIIRNKVIWAKRNPMPTSISDRLNTTYEFVYFFVRSPRYYFDLDAIREPHRSSSARNARKPLARTPKWAGPLAGTQNGLRRARSQNLPGHALGKNPGDIWSIATRGFRGAHFATFPPELVRKPLLATCPEKICSRCGLPWVRKSANSRAAARGRASRTAVRRRRHYPRRWEAIGRLGELRAQCLCSSRTRPGVVLDPFFGTGTVGQVAQEHGRDWVGIELNPRYVEIAKERLKERNIRRAA